MGKGHKGYGPSTKVTSNLHEHGNDYDSDGNRIDGICKHCNEWSAELVSGECKDVSCRRKRLEKRVADGLAIRFSTDVLGADGKPGVSVETGKKKFFVKRKK